MELLRRVVLGAVSGAVGTVLMTGVFALGAKAHALGEPPPRKLVRRTMSRLGLSPSRRTLQLSTAAAHVAFGMSMGALYGLLPRAGRGRSRAPFATGPLFGLGVWAASYAGWIPALGLMPPPSRDRPGRPTTMILAHLVYGATLAGARQALEQAFARGSERSTKRAEPLHDAEWAKGREATRAARG